MINKTIKFLIDNKLIAVLILLFFIAWGMVTMPFNWDLGGFPRDRVAVDAIPDIGENQQIVFTKWDGRSPQDIEDQITYPLTTALLGISHVKTIRSSSMFGFSAIYIIFDEKADFYWSRTRILEKLNSLPKNLLPDGVQPALGPDATGLGQIFWYTLEGRDENGQVTGGWDLDELRSIQDYFVKYALSSAKGVSEVASVGGFVKEYQIDVNPAKLQEYGISLAQIVNAIRKTNRDIGAKTIEINQAEYYVRGLGYVKSIKDLEQTLIVEHNNVPVLLKDIARVHLGPADRSGILDKEGAEVVGGVVVARYGANPMEVIENVKKKIEKISSGLPVKTLKDGRQSKLTIVPFYDRSQLIQETLHTLDEALTLEILITILVIIIMVFNLRASALISSLLPVAVLMVFIAMRYFGVDANIVALSGIAIAIGTMVDMGIILTENIIRHLKNKTQNLSIDQIVYKASAEVSGAIITAVMTTIISFLPVFTMIGAEGKLFRPLAFTKTFALLSALLVSLFLIPPFAAIIFKEKKLRQTGKIILDLGLLLAGIAGLYFHIGIAWVLVLLALFNLSQLKPSLRVQDKYKTWVYVGLSVIAVLWLLTENWQPFGIDKAFIINFLFIVAVSLGLLGFFFIFRKYYARLLAWALAHKLLFLSIPTAIFIAGILAMNTLGKEFMPALDEGAFLLMPTTMPHAGVSENKRVLQQLDMAVAQIPEVTTVVGKAGRVESALDPAPLSMFENIINYRSEYIKDADGRILTFKTDDDGFFFTKSGKKVADGTRNKDDLPENTVYFADDITLIKELIPDEDGKPFRQWRQFITTPDDIWQEIVKVTDLPGVTSAPKLQPIQTRLIMLQTGMRAPMGVKIKGNSLKQIEAFGLVLEDFLKKIPGIKKEAVFADRVIGKPYLLIDIKRDKIARYGLHIDDVQNAISVAVGGKKVTTTVEGRERYGVRVRYPRELRSQVSDLENILIDTTQKNQIPLKEVADIKYEQGPQVIKSEDTFLVSYVLFDKEQGEAETDVVEKADKALKAAINRGDIKVPKGLTYSFTGTYENQIRAEKTLKIVVPLALFLIFLILYFQFRSATLSLMIFSGIAVAFAGGFIMLWLYGQDWFLNFEFFGVNLRQVFQIHPVNLSVAVWVGFIALFGIATDDGVVMGTYLVQVFDKNNPKTKQEIRQAILEAGNKRIRPCLMTTATTILALLPVLTSTGRGSDIMVPMAIPSFGGMLVALITLFVVPVLFAMKKEMNVNG